MCKAFEMINNHHDLKLEEINEQETTMMKNLINKQLKKEQISKLQVRLYMINHQLS